MPECRSCNKKLKTVFVDLGLSPIANALVKNPNSKENFYPLKSYVCDHCYLVQLEDYESCDVHFNDDYVYFSSYSSSWLSHCKDYVEMITRRLALDSKSQVIEIASNDGYLLQYYKGIPVLGIEPCENVAKVARERGIETISDFFGSNLAKTLPKADLISGANVLAHVPDINDFVKGLKIALKENGTITIEFPHLLNLIKYNQFDTIYHEHYSYLSLIATKHVFEKNGLKIYDVEEIPTHGGSLRVYASHAENNNLEILKSVDKLLEEEINYGLKDIKVYSNYGEKVKSTKRDILSLLIKLKNDNKKIVAYGAAAKASTLMNYCGVGTDFVDYIVDKSPHKQNKYLPGVRIPILDPKKLDGDNPDYVVIMAWNLKDEIIAQLSSLKTKFIVLIPGPEIIG